MLSMHSTHTEAIPEWRTQCTRGVIYYTELTIPRTITASLSNRLKMASQSVYAQTGKHTRSAQCIVWIKHGSKLCTTDNLSRGEKDLLLTNWVINLWLTHTQRNIPCMFGFQVVSTCSEAAQWLLRRQIFKKEKAKTHFWHANKN